MLARALGIFAIAAHGVDRKTALIAHTKAAACFVDDPAIGLDFVLGDAPPVLREEEAFPAGIVLYVGPARGVPNKQLLFAVKANPAQAILTLLADDGYGADIVSSGELTAARGAGIPARRIVYSGAGKTQAELAAALDAGSGSINLEHEREGELLSALAVARGTRALVLPRVNPGVDAGTHAKITTGTSDSKFGVPRHHLFDQIEVAARWRRLPNGVLVGPDQPPAAPKTPDEVELSHDVICSDYSPSIWCLKALALRR